MKKITLTEFTVNEVMMMDDSIQFYSYDSTGIIDECVQVLSKDRDGLHKLVMLGCNDPFGANELELKDIVAAFVGNDIISVELSGSGQVVTVKTRLSTLNVTCDATVNDTDELMIVEHSKWECDGTEEDWVAKQSL